MKLKAIMLAAMLAGSLSTTAHAGLIDGVTTPDIQLKQNSTKPNYWSASFGNAPTAGIAGAFSDVFTFTPVLTNGGWGSGGLINFSLLGPDSEVYGGLESITATLNGNSFTQSAVSPGVFTLSSVLLGPGPLTLTISGIVGEGGGSYGGNINVVTAVPEPATYGMMLGGLALLGYVARRRKQG